MHQAIVSATMLLLMLGVWFVHHQGHTALAVFLGCMVGFWAGWHARVKE